MLHRNRRQIDDDDCFQRGHWTTLISCEGSGETFHRLTKPFLWIRESFLKSKSGNMLG